MSGPITEHQAAASRCESEPAAQREIDRSRARRAGNPVLELQRRYGNRFVQRMLTVARQAAGEGQVSDHVEAAINRSRGAGQPLERTIRNQMEPAFGADFSGVRVHTGGEADRLNREVNAVAFTTGSDIFFREGAYDPGSSGGRELLAHELTHVVQQSGSVVQGKLTLGPPDDEYEKEADRVARTVAGAIESGGAPPAGESVRRACACGNSAGPGGECEECKQKASAASPDALQRQPAPSPQLQNGSITFGGTATASKDAGPDPKDVAIAGTAVALKQDDVVTLPKDVVKRDSDGTMHGKIRMDINAHWQFTGGLTGQEGRSGQGKVIVDAPFRLQKPDAKNEDDTGIKAGAPRIVRQESSGTGASLDTSPAVTPDVDDTGFSITVAPRVTYQEQTALSGQLGVDLAGLLGSIPGLGGPLAALLKALGATGALQLQNQTANTQALGASFTAKLPVTKPAPPVPPAPLPYHCERTDPDFSSPTGAFGPFVIASDRFMKDDDARQSIHDWYFGLDPMVRQDLEKGKGTLRITGRASRTGTPTFNLDLAKKRAEKVRDIVKDFAGTDAHFNSFALGEFGAQTKDKVEKDQERRVDVVIDGQVPGEDVAKMIDKVNFCSEKPGPSGPPNTPTGPTGPLANPQDTETGGTSGSAPESPAGSSPQPQAAAPGVTTTPAVGISSPPGSEPPQALGPAPASTAGEAVAGTGEDLTGTGVAAPEPQGAPAAGAVGEEQPEEATV